MQDQEGKYQHLHNSHALTHNSTAEVRAVACVCSVCVRTCAWILFPLSSRERRCFHNTSLDGGPTALHMVQRSPKICHLFDTLQVMTLTPSCLRCFVHAGPRGRRPPSPIDWNHRFIFSIPLAAKCLFHSLGRAVIMFVLRLSKHAAVWFFALRLLLFPLYFCPQFFAQSILL